MNQILLQIPTLLQVNAADGSGEGVVETTHEYTLWEMLASGGWYIMIPMAIISVMTVYIAIERYLAISRAQREEKSFMLKVREYIHDGKLDAAKNLCTTTDSPVARMIEKGISKIGKPIDDIKASIENIGKIEVYRL